MQLKGRRREGERDRLRTDEEKGGGDGEKVEKEGDGRGTKKGENEGGRDWEKGQGEKMKTEEQGGREGGSMCSVKVSFVARANC